MSHQERKGARHRVRCEASKEVLREQSCKTLLSTKEGTYPTGSENLGRVCAIKECSDMGGERRGRTESKDKDRELDWSSQIASSCGVSVDRLSLRGQKASTSVDRFSCFLG